MTRRVRWAALGASLFGLGALAPDCRQEPPNVWLPPGGCASKEEPRLLRIDLLDGQGARTIPEPFLPGCHYLPFTMPQLLTLEVSCAESTDESVAGVWIAARRLESGEERPCPPAPTEEPAG